MPKQNRNTQQHPTTGQQKQTPGTENRWQLVPSHKVELKLPHKLVRKKFICKRNIYLSLHQPSWKAHFMPDCVTSVWISQKLGKTWAELFSSKKNYVRTLVSSPVWQHWFNRYFFPLWWLKSWKSCFLSFWTKIIEPRISKNKQNIYLCGQT